MIPYRHKVPLRNGRAWELLPFRISPSFLPWYMSIMIVTSIRPSQLFWLTSVNRTFDWQMPIPELSRLRKSFCPRERILSQEPRFTCTFHVNNNFEIVKTVPSSYSKAYTNYLYYSLRVLIALRIWRTLYSILRGSGFRVGAAFASPDSPSVHGYGTVIALNIAKQIIKRPKKNLISGKCTNDNRDCQWIVAIFMCVKSQ